MPPSPLRLLLIAGARPNFMKVAPLIHAIQRHNASRITDHSSPITPEIQFKLVHTGQHYDANMSDVFFRDLGIPKPDYHLEVGSGSHAVQTANVMLKFEPVLLNAFNDDASISVPLPSLAPARSGGEGGRRSGEGEIHGKVSLQPAASQSRATGLPDWVVVVGDVNSTVACTLVAVKMAVKVAHVEAGLRSFDRTMPEEINRLVTDSISDLLLTPSEDGDQNLLREGIPASRIRRVGNIMIDSLVAHAHQAESRDTLCRLGLKPGHFIYVTLHRPSNVDSRESLAAIVHALSAVAGECPVVFPIHPRTRNRLTEFGLSFSADSAVKLLDPVGYHDSISLTRHARCVITDSGGLQEESTYFRTPCLTLRPNTERPVTVTLGSNQLTIPSRLQADLDAVLNGTERCGSIPPLWDGRTAERIIQTLLSPNPLPANCDLSPDSRQFAESASVLWIPNSNLKT